MLNQKTLALALMLLVSYASADNCEIRWKGALKLKTSLTGLTCTGAGTDPLTECLPCCEVTPGTCGSLYLTDAECPTTHYDDRATLSRLAKAATAATFTANCCFKKKTCDIDCVAIGWKNAPDYATKECDTEKCDTLECCDTDESKCYADKGNCKDGYYRDPDKWGVSATKDTYHEKCCTAKITCDGTCPANLKKKDQYATIKCKYQMCRANECCENDPYKCKSVSSQVSCDKDEVMNDGAAITPTAGLTTSILSKYKSQCCVKKTTCEAFKAAKLEVSGATKQPSSQTTKQPNQPNNQPNSQTTKQQEVSGAVKQQALAAAMLLSMGGYLSIGK